jgi:hypothetical protein
VQDVNAMARVANHLLEFIHAPHIVQKAASALATTPRTKQCLGSGRGDVGGVVTSRGGSEGGDRSTEHGCHVASYEQNIAGRPRFAELRTVRLNPNR